MENNSGIPRQADEQDLEAFGEQLGSDRTISGQHETPEPKAQAPAPPSDEYEFEDNGERIKLSKAEIADLHRRRQMLDQTFQTQTAVLAEQQKKTQELNQLLDYLEQEKQQKTSGGQAPKDITIKLPNGKTAKLQDVFTTVVQELKSTQDKMVQMQVDQQIADFQREKELSDDEMQSVLKYVVENNVPNIEHAYKAVFFDNLSNMKEEEAFAKVSNLLPSKRSKQSPMTAEQRENAELLHFGKFLNR